MDFEAENLIQENESAAHETEKLNKSVQFYKDTMKLIKMKMNKADALIRQYNDKMKECQLLNEELSSLKSEKQDILRKYNVTMEKMSKLELMNMDYKNSFEKYQNTTDKQKIKLDENDKHINQLIFKIKSTEDQNATAEEKIKTLEQEIKCCRIALKAFEKKCNVQKPIQESLTINLQKRDISVLTDPIIIGPKKVKMKDEFVMTDAEKEPFPIFCTKCEVRISPAPIEQILKIMSSTPPLLSESLSPPNSPKFIDKSIEINEKLETNSTYIKNDNSEDIPCLPHNAEYQNIMQTTEKSPQLSFMELDKLSRKINKLEHLIKKSRIKKKKNDSFHHNCCSSKNIKFVLQLPNQEKFYKFPKREKRRTNKLYFQNKKNNAESKKEFQKSDWVIEDCSKIRKRKIISIMEDEIPEKKGKCKNKEEEDLFDCPEVIVPNNISNDHFDKHVSTLKDNLSPLKYSDSLSSCSEVTEMNLNENEKSSIADVNIVESVSKLQSNSCSSTTSHTLECKNIYETNVKKINVPKENLIINKINEKVSDIDRYSISVGIDTSEEDKSLLAVNDNEIEFDNLATAVSNDNSEKLSTDNDNVINNEIEKVNENHMHYNTSMCNIISDTIDQSINKSNCQIIEDENIKQDENIKLEKPKQNNITSMLVNEIFVEKYNHNSHDHQKKENTLLVDESNKEIFDTKEISSIVNSNVHQTEKEKDKVTLLNNISISDSVSNRKCVFINQNVVEDVNNDIVNKKNETEENLIFDRNDIVSNKSVDICTLKITDTDIVNMQEDEKDNPINIQLTNIQNNEKSNLTNIKITNLETFVEESQTNIQAINIEEDKLDSHLSVQFKNIQEDDEDNKINLLSTNIQEDEVNQTNVQFKNIQEDEEKIQTNVQLKHIQEGIANNQISVQFINIQNEDEDIQEDEEHIQDYKEDMQEVEEIQENDEKIQTNLQSKYIQEETEDGQENVQFKNIQCHKDNRTNMKLTSIEKVDHDSEINTVYTFKEIQLNNLDSPHVTKKDTEENKCIFKNSINEIEENNSFFENPNSCFDDDVNDVIDNENSISKNESCNYKFSSTFQDSVSDNTNDIISTEESIDEHNMKLRCTRTRNKLHVGDRKKLLSKIRNIKKNSKKIEILSKSDCKLKERFRLSSFLESDNNSEILSPLPKGSTACVDSADIALSASALRVKPRIAHTPKYFNFDPKNEIDDQEKKKIESTEQIEISEDKIKETNDKISSIIKEFDKNFKGKATDSKFSRTKKKKNTHKNNKSINLNNEKIKTTNIIDKKSEIDDQETKKIETLRLTEVFKSEINNIDDKASSDRNTFDNTFKEKVPNSFITTNRKKTFKNNKFIRSQNENITNNMTDDIDNVNTPDLNSEPSRKTLQKYKGNKINTKLDVVQDDDNITNFDGVNTKTTNEKTQTLKEMDFLNNSQGINPVRALRSRQIIIPNQYSFQKNVKKKSLPRVQTIDNSNSSLGNTTVVACLNDCLANPKIMNKFYRKRLNILQFREDEKQFKKQIQRLMNIEDWTVEVHNEILEKLISTLDMQILAYFIIEYASECVQEYEVFDKSYTPPAPIMTKREQKLVTLILEIDKSKPDFCKCIIEGIQFRLFKFYTIKQAQLVDRLFRILVVLNKIKKDREKVRIFCCDALYCFNFRAIDIIYVALTSWPEVFPKYSPNNDIVVKTIVHIIMTIKVESSCPRLNSVKKLLFSYYNYPNTGYTLDSMKTELLKNLQENAPGISTAIILFCKKMTPEWTIRNIVKELKQIIVTRAHPSLYDALTLLGCILRSIPINSGFKEIYEIMDQLCDVLDKSSGDDDLQESVVSCLISICKFNFEKVARCVLMWQFNKSLRPSTQVKLMTFFKTHDVKYWWKFVKENFSPPEKEF